MPEVTNETLQTLMTLATTYGLRVAGGIALLVVGWIVAGSVSAAVRRLLERRTRVDMTLQRFFSSMVRYAILALVIIAVLAQFGVQTASVIALLGALGFAVGLALQGTLSHFAAGVMILLFRPFRIGDYVEVAGHSGTVKDLKLFTTELATPDNVQIIIPNGAVWGSSVVNYSFHAQRRVDFNIGIAYSDDIGRALDIVERVIGSDRRILREPAHQVVVGELADSSVNLIIRVWVEAGDYWNVKFDFTRQFKEAFDQGGISIPFPQTELHLAQTAVRNIRAQG